MKNNSILDKVYVEEHHDPIIDKEQWTLVQVELERRKRVNKSYSGTNEFLGKIVCGECGGLFGKKVVYSTDKYKGIKYRCNNKYLNEHHCHTPWLDEKKIEDKFIVAYNCFMGSIEKVVEDTNEILSLLTDISFEEKKLKELTDKAEFIVLKVHELMDRNSKEEMNQDDAQKEYEEYDLEHQKIMKKINNLNFEISNKEQKAKEINSFIELLKTRPLIIDTFDRNLFAFIIEKAVVNADGSITFVFRNKKEIVE